MVQADLGIGADIDRQGRLLASAILVASSIATWSAPT
jgi:hypothetical protein